MSKNYFIKNWNFLKSKKKTITKIGLLLTGSLIYSKIENANSIANCWFSRLYTNDSNRRINSLQYAANNPIEDKFIHGNLNSVPGYVSCVFDGHGGWQVSKYISENFIDVLNNKLDNIKDDLNEKNVKNALIETFDTLEKNYINLIKTSYLLGFGKLASVGACALVTLVIDNKLYVANLGDSKGILFSKLKRKK